MPMHVHCVTYWSTVVIGDDVLHPYGIYTWLNVAENSFHTVYGFVYTIASSVSV